MQKMQSQLGEFKAELEQLLLDLEEAQQALEAAVVLCQAEVETK